MTRATPKARRFWISVAGNGNVQGWWPQRPAKHEQHGKSVHIVECIPVPRVTVREDTKLHLSVLLNGEFVRAFNDRAVAVNYAKALRRALRGGR